MLAQITVVRAYARAYLLHLVLFGHTVVHIDIELHAPEPGATVYYPFTLPVCNEPAVAGVNIVDNVEQIVVNNPEIGLWRLQIFGKAIHLGPQDYSCAISDNYVSSTIARYVNGSAETLLDYGGTPYSAVTLDYNGDGYKDMMITISDGTESALFAGYLINDNGIPEFYNTTDADIEDGDEPQGGLRGLSVADYDNDGDPDIFAADAIDPRLYENDNGFFTDKAADTGLDLLARNSTMGTWGDYDRDGELDLYVVRAISWTEPPSFGMGWEYDRLLRNVAGPQRHFVDMTATLGLASSVTTASVTAAWADIDDDGDQDLFVGEINEPPTGPPGGVNCKLFINQDGRSFVEDFDNRLPVSQVIWVTGVSWADMDNDADLDLVVSTHTYKPWVFFNDGNGYFTEYMNANTTDGYIGHQVYDHDLDGRQDLLLLAQESTEFPRLYSNRLVADGLDLIDETVLVNLDDVGRVNGSVAADFNGDGDYDLYLGRPVSSNEFYYKAIQDGGSETLEHHYVKVRLSSPHGANNRFGIGALVTITAGDHTQAQIVDGGSMRGGQSDRNLIFGLGDYSGPVTASVKWPGGHVQDGISLTIDSLTEIEDDTSPTVDDNSVTSTYTGDPVTLLVDWIFTWETDVSCRASLDKVTFDLAGLPPNCQPELSEISATTPGVAHSYEAMPGGAYRHQLIWLDRECVPLCNYDFYVTSGTDQVQDDSTTKTLRIKVCAQHP